MNATMVRPGDTIKAVLATASQVPPKDRGRTEEELRQLKTARQKLLAVEGEARQEIEERIAQAEIRMLSLKYPILSTEPLKWRDKDGFPKIIPFGIGSEGIVNFTSEGRRPLLPSPLWECYLDVTAKLGKLRWRRPLARWHVRIGLGLLVSFLLIVCTSAVLAILGYSLRAILPEAITELYATIAVGILSVGVFLLIDAFPVLQITASFEGIIPAETKQRIKKAEEAGVFGGIYILAEVEKWDIKKIVAPILDPLVVGLAHDTLYLIDTFDTTRLEEYVKQEFAVRES